MPMVFLAGIVNDVVVGIPIGFSSFCYLLICAVTAYLRNITITPNFINDWISFSGRIDGKWVRKISGAHAHHSNMLMSPVFSKDQGHRKVNISGGINFVIPSGELKGHRLALEYNNPIYQYFDGLQMKSDKRVTLGWQYAFTFKDLF